MEGPRGSCFLGLILIIIGSSSHELVENGAFGCVFVFSGYLILEWFLCEQ